MAKATKTCKICNEDGLQWRRMPNGKWVLFVADPDGDASDIQHVHRVTADAPADAPKPVHEPMSVSPVIVLSESMTHDEMMKVKAMLIESPVTAISAVETVKAKRTKKTADDSKALPNKKTADDSKALPNNARWYEVLERICNGLKNGSLDSIRVLLIGPPGTGKSTTAEILSDAMARIPVHQGMGVEELVGQYHLEAGATVWKDDCITLAMKAGKPVVIDEIDRYSDEIGSILYGVTDDRPYVKLGAGNIVKAVKGFSVIATMNPGISVLPEAIVDRFECIITAVEPHPEANKFEDEARSGAVTNYFRALPTNTWDWSGKPTVRRMRAFTKYEPIVGRKHALQLAFGQAAEELESVLSTSGVTKGGR